MDKNASKKKPHAESHLVHRMGWLRASVLGANDGILSIASIVSGMAAGSASRETVLLALSLALTTAVGMLFGVKT